MNWAAITWAGLLVFFVIMEAACPLHLVSVWFAAGSFASMVAALLGAELWLQIVLFVVVSGALLIALWPMTKKLMNQNKVATNVDSILGALAHVTADIDNLEATGQVKINGLEWTARSADGNPIAKGTLVRIERVEGVKLIVSPAEA